MREPSTTTTPPAREAPVERLVRAMLVNLGAGILIALATLLFHDQIVAHQLAASSPAGPAVRDSLSATLWSRPAPAVAVALLYPLFIRRLRQHQRRGYRRTVIVGIAQLASLAWFSLGSDYPDWLRVAEGVQALAVLGVLWAATRPDLRRLFDYPAPTAATRSGHWVAVTLFVLAPLVAEVTWGSTRASQLVGLLFYFPLYGAGALLIRELARRAGRGLPTILLLGVAYGLLEEGVALQSLTSRTIYPSMTGIVPQLAGVNVSYTLMVLVYHAVFSIAIPITLAELIHPSVRATPWLRTPGLVVTGVVLLFGLGLTRLIPLSADPHYLMPWADDVVFAVLVIALAALALRGFRPRATVHSGVAGPSVVTVAGLALLGTLVFLGLLMPLPGVHHAGYAPTAGLSWIAVLVALAVGVVALVVGIRWARSSGWTDRHTLAAVTAALIGHTVIGLLTLVHTTLDRGALGLFGVIEIVLLGMLIHRTGQRAEPRPVRDDPSAVPSR